MYSARVLRDWDKKIIRVSADKNWTNHWATGSSQRASYVTRVLHTQLGLAFNIFQGKSLKVLAHKSGSVAGKNCLLFSAVGRVLCINETPAWIRKWTERLANIYKKFWKFWLKSFRGKNVWGLLTLQRGRHFSSGERHCCSKWNRNLRPKRSSRKNGKDYAFRSSAYSEKCTFSDSSGFSCFPLIWSSLYKKIDSSVSGKG